MAVGVETTYLFNGFPYVGKNESNSGDVSVPSSDETYDALIQEGLQRNQ